MRSVMSHQFSQVPRAEIPRSSFNRSHGYKTTLNAGYLIPIFVDEALPGDTFNLKLNAFARMATPLHPVMDNLFADFFFFAVPKRLIWDNFQKFMGEQDNPDDPTDYIEPTMTAPSDTGYEVGSLSDYFGIPTGVPDLVHVSAWHRAYNLIYKEWFRDQNLQDSPVINKGDGGDSPDHYPLRRRGKRHDYFTSALPWPQKGPAVTMPVGGFAPIVGDGTIEGTGAPTWHWKTQGGNDEIGGIKKADTTSTANISMSGTPLGAGGVLTDPAEWTNPNLLLPLENVTADLGAATAADINVIRQAFQIQKILERDARGGTRYTELIHAHFGVTSPDARLQRPEYLGGGSVPVNINPIAQTSNVTGQPTPQGNLAAIGTFHASNVGFTKSFTEHCVLIGLVSIRADLTYQQGLDRMFSRSTRFDHYWPALSHIGEQAVLNKEIYAQGPAVQDEDDNPIDELVFGYQERYAEYRYKPSVITGQFRSTYAQSLDTWHLSQEFENLPVLGDEFIVDEPPIDRVIAVSSEPHFIYDSYIDLTCARPMPVYSVPGLIDHF